MPIQLIPSGIGSLIRFLTGILLLQCITLLLAYTALQTDWQRTWPMFALLGLAIGILAAFWFNTIVAADRHRTVSRVSERFSKEREKIRVRAEQQRAKDGRANERLAAKAKRASFGMSLKTGLVVGGTFGVGVAMMLAQFMTLGLATLAAGGGLALGYGARVRQEKRLAEKRLAAAGPAPILIDIDQDATAVLPPPPARKFRNGPV